jgi:hypothetical protein
MHKKAHTLFCVSWLLLLVHSDGQTTCLDAGFYLNTATGTCAHCPAGSKCPAGESARYACPVGQFQPMTQQSGCLDCLESYSCPSSGLTAPTACPAGTITPPGSASCGTECDYENYYYHAGSRTCRVRTVVCNYNLQYEVQTPLNRTHERECRALRACNTARMDRAVYPIMNAP